MNIIKEDEIIKGIMPNAESYTLANNYGWKWEANDIKYCRVNFEALLMQESIVIQIIHINL